MSIIIIIIHSHLTNHVCKNLLHHYSYLIYCDYSKQIPTLICSSLRVYSFVSLYYINTMYLNK